MTNGPDLRTLRRGSNVSVTALAKHLGVARQTLHTYERMIDLEDQLGPQFVAEYRDGVRELAKIREAK